MTDHAIHLQSENGPLFYQIYDYFKTEIDEGHLAPGVLLPSIRKCAESLGVMPTSFSNPKVTWTTFPVKVIRCWKEA